MAISPNHLVFSDYEAYPPSMPASCSLCISVIIPVYNGGTNFQRCLLSLAAVVPAPREIVVVADGDTDGSWLLAKDFGARVFRMPTPGGPARARNLGARRAKGDILFFIDADVTVPRDAISQVLAAFQSDPDLTALIGSYDDQPFETNFLSQYKNLFHHYVHQTGHKEAFTFWGACGAIRRETFLSLGGFDERYRRPSIEDIELGYRLKKADHRIRLLKELKIKHLKHWGVLSLLKTDFFCRALPWTALILSGDRFTDDLNLKISNRISVMLTYILFLSLFGAFFKPWLMALTLLLILVLLVLNLGLYRFFKNKRGLGFVVKMIPWHWLYFFYSGLAFSIGFANHHFRRFGFMRHL